MTTKKVILLSAATYFTLNTIIWFLGWLVWPIGILAGWLLCGYLGWRFYKKYSGYASDLVPFLIFGPLWLICAFFDYKEEILAEIGLPKFRNPFFWPEK